MQMSAIPQVGQEAVLELASTPAAARREPLAAPILPRHIPSLDGLRAVAILGVLVGHLANTKGMPEVFEHLGVSRLGNVGVRLFFLISGFLITTLLLSERDRAGRIDLRAFYIRRALRIFPASLTFIAVMYLCHLGGLITLTTKDLVHAVTYTANYNHGKSWMLHQDSWYLNHLWSLSVEEQFYLLWPGLLVLIGLKGGRRATIGAILVVPFIRWAMYLSSGGADIALSREFQAVADALSTGCLLSLLHRDFSGSPRYMAFVRSPLAPTVGLAAVAAGYGSHFVSAPFSFIAGQSLANIGLAVILDYSIRAPEQLWGRLLNLRFMAFIGTLSYSLYLWQEPFLYYRSTAWIAAFPVNIVLVFAAALSSYYFVERPFLKQKEALRHASARRALSAAAVS